MKNITLAFVELTESALMADFTSVRRLGSRVAKELASNGEMEAAKRLQSILRKKSVPLRTSGYSESLPLDSKSRTPLIEELNWPQAPLFLSKENKTVFLNFISEISNVDRLAKLGLATRPRLLLSGPPGTGKTLMATHIAAQLSLPIYVVRLDSLISSFLGETAKNIRSVFEFISSHNGVLLIDEIDAVAKMRDDRQELGELKRVVNTLIQGLDSLDEYPAVIGATNHEKLLDPAIWRRFPYKAELTLPDQDARNCLWNYYLYEDKANNNAMLLSAISESMSCSDIMEASLAERRRSAIYNSDIDIARVTLSVTSYLRGLKKSFSASEKVNLEEKRDAISFLASLNLKKQDIASLLNISRQTVYKHTEEKPS